MKIIPSNYKTAELPLRLKLSFESVFEYLEKVATQQDHYLKNVAVDLLEEYKKYSELREGFEDFSLLEKYENEIDKLLDILFPEMLQNNLIKAITMPFEFTTFKLSKRFAKILENAGESYEFKIRNFDPSNIYILSCIVILAYYYKTTIDFRRPFFFDIPDSKSGLIRTYKTLINGDHLKVTPLENAPKITDEDVKQLIDNFNNIEIWKEKFPPNSYEFKGFGVMNLFDSTPEQSLSNLKENLLRNDHAAFDDLKDSISSLFGSKTVQFGISYYNLSKENIGIKNNNNQKSYLIQDQENFSFQNFFCEHIQYKIFEDNELLAISDIEAYGKENGYNGIYKSLKAKGINSVILVPLKIKDHLFVILELVSEKKYELNSINAHKLKDVVPVFKIAVKRYIEEYTNKIESVIQENYTTLHPTVKWKFYEEAEEYLYYSESEKKNKSNLNNIVFKNVIPLFGQTDIKGSSIARNIAIQKDLIKQLSIASNIIEIAASKFKLPIYNDLLFRIDSYFNDIRKELNSGDEVALTQFLRTEIYPIFNHLKTIDKELKIEVDNYMNLIDDKLHVIYDERKNYDNSVNILNQELANYIDKKQEEAQHMFPHYFERYKTDGIDYNIYIGQSLVKDAVYNDVYLHNLRLWQLETTCELENLVFKLKDTLEHPLEVASLILVHSSPLAIRFRMDEKRFDVDGAYNIRYEILKKRIDKALIKGSNERLTQPGKIAIVYSNENDAIEYNKHITYLKAKKYIVGDVENLILEDLQGIAGLKAIRVEVNYELAPKKEFDIDDFIKSIENSPN